MKYRFHSLAAVLLIAAAQPAPASAQTTEERRQRGDAVVRSLNNGAPQPALESLREDFPFLAEATEGFALGDVWSRPGLDPRTRQIAAVVALASLGETAYMAVHARYALNIGVSEDELKEAVHMVTVTAGFPRALSASQALAELLADREREPR